MYTVDCKKHGEDCFVIFKEKGSARSDAWRVDLETALSLIDAITAMLKGETYDASLVAGDPLSFIAQSDGTYMLSIAITESFYQGYDFDLKGMKLFRASLGVFLR